MRFRSAWRRGSVLVLGAALVSSAFFGAAVASAQAPPTLPSLAIITSVRDASGAAVATGNVSAMVGTTVCQTKPISANLALEIGQPNQPDACKAAAGTITFSVDGRAANETIQVRQGVPQTVALTLRAAGTATPTGTAAPTGTGTAPRPAATGNGGYLSEDGGSLLAAGLGAIALAAVGGSLVVRRVRR
jgi:hypothetical protein